MAGKRTKIARKTVECLLEYYTHTEYKSRWLTFIHDTLTENGMHNIFLNPNNYIHKEFKQRIEDQFYQTHNQDIENTNRAIFYRAVKGNYGFDEVLDDINPQLTHYLIKYITSNHRLPVETGRWYHTPFYDRHCTLCIGKLGDEFHYLFVCPKFTEIRKKYIKAYYYIHPSMFKTKQLFQNKNIKILRRLCLMIKHIMLSFKQNNQ